MDGPGTFVYFSGIMPVHERPQPLTAWARLSVRLLAGDAITIDRRWGPRGWRWWFWRLYHVDTDAVTIRCGAAGELRLQPDRLYAFPAGLRFEAGTRSELAHQFLHFELPGLPLPLQERVFTQVVVCPLQEPMRSLYQEWRGHLASGTAQGPAALTLAQHVVQRCWHDMLPDRRRELERALVPDGLVQGVQACLAECYAEAVALPELAARFDVSADHLARKFRRHCGVSIQEWRRSLRLRRACELLVESEHSIDAIAQACGYSDRYYFSRVFSRRFHDGPASYRRRHR